MVQMTIFDFLEEEKPIDQKLLEQLAGDCRPYWTDSLKKIREACSRDASINEFTEIIRHEYCPYGYAGGSRFAGANEMEEFLFRPQNIRIWYKDGTGTRKEVKYSWKDFARHIYYLIEKGEYIDEN